jgi:hypothetical protein
MTLENSSGSLGKNDGWGEQYFIDNYPFICYGRLSFASGDLVRAA